MKIKQWVLFLALVNTVSVNADIDIPEQLSQLRRQWAVIKYETEAGQQEQAFNALAESLHLYNQQHSGQAEGLIWEAIVLSTKAGVEGSFSALKSVKQAKALLEQAIALNPAAMNNGAYISLGALYYQVPGWPLSFGDNDLARENLELAVQKSPNSIDANFFYAEFLKSQGENDKALEYYQRALNAPKRSNRPLADKGRRGEIMQAMQSIKK